MKNSNSNLPPAVAEMAQIPLTGNIVPSRWFKTIIFDNGKPDLSSILILADLCYWHRPTEIRDERSGAVIGYKKKFAEDLLRKSYSDLQTQFGLSDRQLRDCFSRLEKRGVIRRIFRTLDSSAGRLNNIMYIELFPSVVKELTHGKLIKSFAEKSLDPINMESSPYHDRTGQGVTSNVTTITIERDSYPVITGDHIETNITSNISSLSEKQTSSENSQPVLKKVEREEFSNSKKMLALWNDLVPEKSTNANSYLLAKLESALRDQLGSDLKAWKTVCENFRSSKFLMGEVENQRLNPSLSWLVDSKEPRVARVFEKQHYTFGDRAIVLPHAQEIKTLDVKNNQLLSRQQIIEIELRRLEDEKKEAEKRFISEKVNSLSHEELENYKAQYEILMKEKGEEAFPFQEGRAGRMAQFMFELFLQKQVKDSLAENAVDFSAFVKKETELKEKKEELKTLYDEGVRALAEFKNGGAGMFPEKQSAMK